MTVTPALDGQVGNGRGAATGEIWRIAGPVVVASVELFEGFDVEQRLYLDAGRAAIAASLERQR